MRFLVDECAGPVVAQWLRNQGHEVYSVYEQSRGLADDEILKKANDEDWVLLTVDKDFGEIVYRQGLPHRGVVLLRLDDERASVKISALTMLLQQFSDELVGKFVVVTETRVRIARSRTP